MLELTTRLRRRAALTALSSDPEGWITSNRHRGVPGPVIRVAAAAAADAAIEPVDPFC